MPDDYIARTLRAYDADPDKYESATADMTPVDEFESFMRQLPKSNLPVLDAGCAFGRDTALFAKRGRAVIGIDLSSAFLKRARQLHSMLDFRKMDVRSLTLNDESIAGVWSVATLLHLKDADVRRALKEFWRVLISGGVVAISFKEGGGSEEIVEKFSSNGARYYNYQTEQSVRLLFEDCGFKVKSLHVVNEREQFGPDKRDLNWVWCIAKK